MSPPSVHSELCFGLVLLLEAAEYQNEVHMVTPLCNRKRDHTSIFSPSPTKRVYSMPVVSLPPKKRTKFDFNHSQDPLWLSSNRCTPSNNIKFIPLKKSTKCTGGSTHRVWEPTDWSAASARRFPWNATKTTEEQGTKVAVSDGDKTFILYSKDDDKHINPAHNLIRQHCRQHCRQHQALLKLVSMTYVMETMSLYNTTMEHGVPPLSNV